MNEDEKRIFNELIESRKDMNDRIKCLMRYILILFVIVLSVNSATLLVAIISNNNTINNIEAQHSEVMEEISRQHNETMQNNSELYFTTDYLYPETSINQTQNVDVKGDN